MKPSKYSKRECGKNRTAENVDLKSLKRNQYLKINQLFNFLCGRGLSIRSQKTGNAFKQPLRKLEVSLQLLTTQTAFSQPSSTSSPLSLVRQKLRNRQKQAQWAIRQETTGTNEAM